MTVKDVLANNLPISGPVMRHMAALRLADVLFSTWRSPRLALHRITGPEMGKLLANTS
jgi:hypothetical protein